MLNNKGFTLIELMVVLAITSGAIAMTYWSIAVQQRTYAMQEEVARMQQNLRTAMYIMGSEIRMAGYDPLKSSGAGFINADTNPSTGANVTLQLSMDTTGGESDGEDNDNDGTVDEPDESRFSDGTINPGETVTFSLFDYPSSNPDGDTDIGRNVGAVNQPLAENIEALDFVYLDGSNPPVTLNPGGGTVPAANIPDIRAVQITIIGRVDREDPRFINNTVYNNLQGVQILAAQNDHFHRHILTKIIECRNMGL